ncbi:MAG TPA: hypothetical protein PLZ71_00275, partial [Flavobacterium alvei]|nr:hypothetical protein [Flavobacterium alvei]HQF47073.1 hypothetical protein [Flavobacterium alvei]
ILNLSDFKIFYIFVLLKITTMATITLSYDARNVIAKKTVAYILSLGVFKTINKTAIDLSLEDVKKGRVTTHKSAADYFKNLKD